MAAGFDRYHPRLSAFGVNEVFCVSPTKAVLGDCGLSTLTTGDSLFRNFELARHKHGSQHCCTVAEVSCFKA